jgi:RNA polymerase primary sigma factor
MSRRSVSSEAEPLRRNDLLDRVLELRPKSPKSPSPEYRRALGLLLAANSGLIARIAFRYKRRTTHLELQDLIAEGQLGFCVGVEKFDPSYGAQLSTYAAYWVRAYIRRSVRNTESEIRIPVHQQERGAKFLQPIMLLDDDDEGEEGSGLGAAHFLAAPNPDPIEVIAGKCERAELLLLMDCLTPRQQRVLRLRMQGFTLQDVGRRMHMTRERTRQIEVGALAKLRRLHTKSTPTP